ncbi:MAG: glycoside hydrolase family 9 protein [Chitinophagaceae bacterium]|jgi:endoglucanase|nr:glycoside hydrolase family 9 protein [Chitinophagaceae bacterium]
MKKIISIVALLCTVAVNAQDIRLNQLGFYTGAPKIAVVVNNENATGFYIVSASNNDTVFRGKLSALQSSKNSSLKTKTADFSAFRRTGQFYIAVKGAENSYVFSIGKNVNHPAAVAALKAYYYIRASMPLDKKYAGVWARAEGHPDTVVYIHPSAASAARPAGTIISSRGGWYDAGDYNKYIVNSGISTATLLSAYEDFSSYFDTLKTNIPENGNGIPDILNEAIYNLRWMLTMQDPNDGGVYHKCTDAVFDKFEMPNEDTMRRYAVQKGTAATLDLAAVAAQAARIFKKYKLLKSLSDSCLHAAVAAWNWAKKNPDILYDQRKINEQFLPKITTGAYGDRNMKDEFFWAACELYVTIGNVDYHQLIYTTTKNEKYFQTIQQYLDSSNYHIALPSWNNVAALGVYTLLRGSNNSNSKFMISSDGLAGLLYPLQRSLLKMADNYVDSIQTNAFKTVMGGQRQDFVWGSNANAANQAVLLINAYFLTHKKGYIDAALTNLDYILGRNATGYSFVTGIGVKHTMHPHHRPSVADGIVEPVPGLMAGGPNPGMQDHCHYDFTEPETAYTDLDCSFASNEIAINWNAPLVYIANAIEALQKEVGY